MAVFTVEVKSWQNTLECVVHKERLRDLDKLSLQKRKLWGEPNSSLSVPKMLPGRWSQLT